MLTVLETYNPSLIVRAAGPVLMTGRAAQACLLRVGVHVVGGKQPLALLGVPLVFTGTLPALSIREQVTQALGHDWYLVDETDCREAFGALGLAAGDDTAIVWAAPRFPEAPRPVNYFDEDPE